jgi:hypothetical protein
MTVSKQEHIMGAVLKLPPIAEPKTEQPPKHLKLRKRARILAAVFDGIFWLCAAFNLWAFVMVLVYRGHHAAFGPEGGLIGYPELATLQPGYVYFSDITLPYRLGMEFALITQFVPATLVLMHLRGLFRLYAQGVVFAEENALAFKRMGQWLIAYALAPFVSVKILTLVNLVIDRAWFHNTEIYALGLGTILFIIAEVMRAGREIEQERDEFV